MAAVLTIQRAFDGLLSELTGADLTSGTAVALYTAVPAGKILVVTKILVLLTTVTNLTVAPQIAVGRNDPNYTDIKTAAALTANAAGEYDILTPIAGALRGAAGDVIKAICSTPATADALVGRYLLYGTIRGA